MSVYRAWLVVALSAPYAVEAGRITGRWFDAWYIAQLRKAWRPRP